MNGILYYISSTAEKEKKITVCRAFHLIYGWWGWGIYYRALANAAYLYYNQAASQLADNNNSNNNHFAERII